MLPVLEHSKRANFFLFHIRGPLNFGCIFFKQEALTSQYEPYVPHYNLRLIRNRSWNILNIHKAKGQCTWMNFKKWVKNIQTAGFNGAHAVIRFYNVFLAVFSKISFQTYSYILIDIIRSLLCRIVGGLLNSFWKKQGFLASRRVILLVYTKREWRWSFFYLNNFHPRYIVKQGIDKTWLKIAYFGKSPLDRKKSFRFYAARITPKHWLLNNALTPSHIWKGKKLLTEVHTNHW
jgi:hypothetical protein